MKLDFKYRGSNSQIVFGCGAIEQTSLWIEQLSCKQAIVLCTKGREQQAQNLSDSFGKLTVGVLPMAVMHTPVEITKLALQKVREKNADCLVAIGGGSATGLSKAIAYHTKLPQIVIPTTYAGSEVTPNLGQTENKLKISLKCEQIIPNIVIYDPELTSNLPINTSITSGFNAMAHAIEGLYAKDCNPISSLSANEGLKALISALPKLKLDSADITARSEALYGAWLCGTVLGTVGMALHHKLCHVLGGSFDTPHAETHTILLPHTINFNAKVASDSLKNLHNMLDNSPGTGLYEFAKKMGAPISLKEIGLSEKNLDKASKIATKNPYWNPRPITWDAIRQLLQDAWEGKCPTH